MHLIYYSIWWKTLSVVSLHLMKVMYLIYYTSRWKSCIRYIYIILTGLEGDITYIAQTRVILPRVRPLEKIHKSTMTISKNWKNFVKPVDEIFDTLQTVCLWCDYCVTVECVQSASTICWFLIGLELVTWPEIFQLF